MKAILMTMLNAACLILPLQSHALEPVTTGTAALLGATAFSVMVEGVEIATNCHDLPNKSDLMKQIGLTLNNRPDFRAKFSKRVGEFDDLIKTNKAILERAKDVCLSPNGGTLNSLNPHATGNSFEIAFKEFQEAIDYMQVAVNKAYRPTSPAATSGAGMQ